MTSCAGLRVLPAVGAKLNAIADGIADLMEHLSERLADDDPRADIRELRPAVALEQFARTGAHESLRHDQRRQASP